MTQINTSELFNATRGFDYTLIGLNEVTNGLLSIFLLIAIFVIILVGLRNFSIVDRLISSSVITWLLSVAFWAVGFTTGSVSIVCFVFVVISLLASFVKD